MDPFDMDDAELEAAFQAAKAEELNSEIEPESDQEVVTEEVIDTEEEIADELEQPVTQESDNDADVDDNTEGEKVEDPAEDEADKSEAKEPEVVEPTQPVQKMKVKANGLEYEFTPEEVLEKFPMVFGQSMNYTKKMQYMKPRMKTIDALDEAGLTHDDVNLMIDVLKGDKGAIDEVLKRTGVDTLDLGLEDSNYEPKDYGRDENALDLKNVVEN